MALTEKDVINIVENLLNVNLGKQTINSLQEVDNIEGFFTLAVNAQGQNRKTGLNKLGTNLDNLPIATSADGMYAIGVTESGQFKRVPFAILSGEITPPDPSIVTISYFNAVSITKDYNTQKASLGLPRTITARLSNGLDKVFSVGTWDNGNPSFSPTRVGNTIFTAPITLKDGVTNPRGVKAIATVTIRAEVILDINILSITNPTLSAKPFGTTFAQLGLPSSVTASLVGGGTKAFNVTWVQGSYNGNVAGAKTINGTITVPYGWANPSNKQPTATVEILVEVLSDPYTFEKRVNNLFVSYDETATPLPDHLFDIVGDNLILTHEGGSNLPEYSLNENKELIVKYNKK